MSIISLLGYMGSGKSTYGRLLAEKMNYKFIDLDEYIEFMESKSIRQIFSEKGEAYFREKETQFLKDVLSFSQDTILSLGGGTPIHGQNIDEINSKSKSVYLNASVDTLFNYLRRAKSRRPLIRDLNDEELFAFIDEHLSKRKEFYLKAQLNIVTDDKNVEEIVEELFLLVN